MYFTIAIPYPRYYTMNHLQWECRETPLASQLLAALLLYPSKSLFSWSPSYPQDESVYRCLVCLGNTLNASNSQEEVTTCFYELYLMRCFISRFASCYSRWTPMILWVGSNLGVAKSLSQPQKSSRCSNQEMELIWTEIVHTNIAIELCSTAAKGGH